MKRIEHRSAAFTPLQRVKAAGFPACSSASGCRTVKRRKRRALMRAVLFALACAVSITTATSAPSKPDYSAFSVIPKRNIFNTKRSPEYVPSGRTNSLRIVRSEYLALTGTMRDEKGPLAFFDGSLSDYHRVVKPNENIAGFKVAEIEHAYVKLKNGTNELMLPVNMQLSREEQGEWQLGQRTEPVSSSQVAPNSSETTSETRGRLADSANGRRGDRSDRSDRRDRSRDRRSGSDNSNGTSRSDTTVPPDFPAGVFVPAEATPGAVTNSAPPATSNGPEDILEILRRRREQENSQ